MLREKSQAVGVVDGSGAVIGILELRALEAAL
jgi:hypothetical protein